ncbi:hypothetical protein [Vibrio mexicanus]|uniref:hypothetical protein n=1 Tax=Vibrio mexicanus TaxID=1004326 RepID=UPI00063C0075|nr:hypothetical protein [Vibrio mexicanus]
MNSAQVATSFTHSQPSVSPKREVLLREFKALAKMASAIALPFLLLSLAWI